MSDANDRFTKAAQNIVDAVNRLYDENGNLRPEYRPKPLYGNVPPFDKNKTVSVRKELLRELARVFDRARLNGAIDDYHPGQIGWIISNLNEMLGIDEATE